MQRGKTKPTVAEGHRSYPMPTAGGAVRVPVDLRIIVGMQVNGPWGHNEPSGINHPRSLAGLQATDFGDLAVLYANISFVTRHPCPIDYGASFDKHIELRHKSLLDRV